MSDENEDLWLAGHVSLPWAADAYAKASGILGGVGPVSPQGSPGEILQAAFARTAETLLLAAEEMRAITDGYEAAGEMVAEKPGPERSAG